MMSRACESLCEMTINRSLWSRLSCGRSRKIIALRSRDQREPRARCACPYRRGTEVFTLRLSSTKSAKCKMSENTGVNGAFLKSGQCGRFSHMLVRERRLTLTIAVQFPLCASSPLEDLRPELVHLLRSKAVVATRY